MHKTAGNEKLTHKFDLKINDLAWDLNFGQFAEYQPEIKHPKPPFNRQQNGDRTVPQKLSL